MSVDQTSASLRNPQPVPESQVLGANRTRCAFPATRLTSLRNPLWTLAPTSSIDTTTLTTPLVTRPRPSHSDIIIPRAT
jgi:hypothetical protein